MTPNTIIGIILATIIFVLAIVFIWFMCLFAFKERCPRCGSYNTRYMGLADKKKTRFYHNYKCNKCKYEWEQFHSLYD